MTIQKLGEAWRKSLKMAKLGRGYVEGDERNKWG